MSGFAVECGWAIGEAIMIPHLLGLRLSAALAGLIYLVNPIFSVVLATLVGNWSDRCTRCNRRHPFILAFAVLAVLGFGCLLFSPYLTNLPVQIMVVYLSFGIADLSTCLRIRAWIRPNLTITEHNQYNWTTRVDVSMGFCH